MRCVRRRRFAGDEGDGIAAVGVFVVDGGVSFTFIFDIFPPFFLTLARTSPSIIIIFLDHQSVCSTFANAPFRFFSWVLVVGRGFSDG